VNLYSFSPMCYRTQLKFQESVRRMNDLACPFCGSSAFAFMDRGINSWAIHCIGCTNSIRYSPPKMVRKFVRQHRQPVRDRDGGLLLPADDWAVINKFGLQTQLKPDFSNVFDLVKKARRRDVQLWLGESLRSAC
jgi:hypothetical protein